jgi:hypothetical protein
MVGRIRTEVHTYSMSCGVGCIHLLWGASTQQHGPPLYWSTYGWTYTTFMLLCSGGAGEGDVPGGWRRTVVAQRCGKACCQAAPVKGPD